MNRTKIILEEFRKAQGTPFVWDGRNDCLGFAANIAERILGFDAVADMRGRYTSETGVKRVMLNEGWSGFADGIAAYFREVPTSLARTGDWAIVVNEGGSETIGVVAGEKIVARTPDGAWHVPRSRAVRAFRVE